MTVLDVVLIVCLFGLALVIGDLVLGRVLDTDAHKDARRRADLGDKWWHAE